MLQKLIIQNYAIIDELEIDFSNKLNVITGETGAGKSIIVGALGLILGERADTTVLVNKDRKCFVEGTFGAKARIEIAKCLEENDLEANDELIIRREINPSGKSRAFVNDTPVTLSQLSKLSALLVDLHKQFDSLDLTETNFQREVLDALADHAGLINNYQQVFRQWQSTKREWEQLKEQKRQFEKELDYNQFQFNELEDAAFRQNELEDLDSELKLLSNSEGIRETLSRTYHELKEADTPIVQQLKILINQLRIYCSYHNDLPALTQRLQSVQIELQDIAEEAEHISSQINYNPAKIEQINERLSFGYKLLKKHGVKTTNELLEIQSQLEDRLRNILSIDDNLEQKERRARELHEQVKKLAENISMGRIIQIKPLEERVNGLLTQVGMPNAKLKVELKKNLDEVNFFGADTIEFLFDANKNVPFLPIRKVASGGELSRLMLCIKSLVAQSIDLPTLIFDEVDTGISGEAARQVGIIMKGLAGRRQVICITHQPQIAGKADAHFFVVKDVYNNVVNVSIRQLTLEERITAVAKMLSGERPTAASIQNAREMVMN
ncbi:MAG TPA: DNA repair protein RecN [Chitinophagaceae bacterium]|nr:DNA repair protein RecN [Chitinophagaceae bacterium]